MLTPRQNFIETIKGGKPDRLVKQFEFMDTDAMFADPWNMTNPIPFMPGDDILVDYWGVSWVWYPHTPGAFPLQDGDRLVVKDIEDWRSYLKPAPSHFDDELWEQARAAYDAVDREQQFVGPMISPGIFETLHGLCGMENFMMAMYDSPDEVHELIDVIVDWECALAKEFCENLHPDILFHHDDFGSKLNTFFSADMFDEYFLEPYKRLYGTWRDGGVEYIVHHSDSYAETLVPEFIEMGMDVWQGGVSTNNLRRVLDEYGGQISLMTGIESAELDVEGWTPEKIQVAVDDLIDRLGGPYFIPCQTQGGPATICEGVYEAFNTAIDNANPRLFS